MTTTRRGSAAVGCWGSGAGSSESVGVAGRGMPGMAGAGRGELPRPGRAGAGAGAWPMTGRRLTGVRPRISSVQPTMCDSPVPRLTAAIGPTRSSDTVRRVPMGEYWADSGGSGRRAEPHRETDDPDLEHAGPGNPSGGAAMRENRGHGLGSTPATGPTPVPTTGPSGVPAPSGGPSAGPSPSWGWAARSTVGPPHVAWSLDRRRSQGVDRRQGPWRVPGTGAFGVDGGVPAIAQKR